MYMYATMSGSTCGIFSATCLFIYMYVHIYMYYTCTNNDIRIYTYVQCTCTVHLHVFYSATPPFLHCSPGNDAGHMYKTESDPNQFLTINFFVLFMYIHVRTRVYTYMYMYVYTCTYDCAYTFKFPTSSFSTLSP